MKINTCFWNAFNTYNLHNKDKLIHITFENIKQIIFEMIYLLSTHTHLSLSFEIKDMAF